MVAASPDPDLEPQSLDPDLVEPAGEVTNELRVRDLRACRLKPRWQRVPIMGLEIPTLEGNVRFSLQHYNNATVNSAITIPQYKFAFGSVADATLQGIYDDLDAHCNVAGTRSSLEVNNNIQQQLRTLHDAYDAFLTSPDPNISPLPKDTGSVELRRQLLSDPTSRRQLLWRPSLETVALVTSGIIAVGSLGFAIGELFYHTAFRPGFDDNAVIVTFTVIGSLLLAGLTTYAVQMRNAYTAPVAARVAIMAEVLRRMLGYVREVAAAGAANVAAGAAGAATLTREAIENAMEIIRSGNWFGMRHATPAEFRTPEEIQTIGREGPQQC